MKDKCDPQLCIILRYLCFHLNQRQFEQEAKKNNQYFGSVVCENKQKNKEERSEQVYLILKKLLFPKYIAESNIRSSLFELDENVVELIKLVHSVEKKEKVRFLESYEKVKSAFRKCGAVCLYCNKVISETFENPYFAQVCMRDFQPKKKCKLSGKVKIIKKASSELSPEISYNGQCKAGLKTLAKFGSQILDAKKNNEQLFAELYKRREECRNVNEATLFVLRRYNSFTPILNSETKYGGGYFLWTGKKGIIIDPGFDFIKNFIKAGFCLSLIDAIVITHAHPDHLVDLPNILTLLYEYNDYLENVNYDEGNLTFRSYKANRPMRKQKIELYLNISSYWYLSGMLNIFDSQSSYATHILEKEMTRNIDENLLLITMPTVHKDCVSENLGVGVCIKDTLRKKSFLYTSDTSITPQLIDDYSRIADVYEITNPALLANIGGIAWNELKATFFAEEMVNANIQVLPKDYRYGNHLGLLGLCSLAQVLQPKIVMISELGSEFHKFRTVFIEEFRNEFGISCLLADLGLSVRIFEHKCMHTRKIQ